MEQTTRSGPTADQRRATAGAFAAWLYDRLIERDYDLSARGGGQRRLAERAGVSAATISRMLRGEVLNPDPEILRRIADVLALPFGEVLVRAGILTAAELSAVQAAPPMDRPPITPEEAARDLGIVDPVAVRMFVANVEAARAAQHERSDRERTG
ncbi:helix-turn-helix domain-containing protein [Streptomyces sp. NPDC020983]|uniref:helix-turn-helix domain-containing protein n=1 Tax=Streptomyces sp. NPDC020983 TaxID=3365106 RepID=UPI0037A439B6